MGGKLENRKKWKDHLQIYFHNFYSCLTKISQLIFQAENSIIIQATTGKIELRSYLYQ